MHISFAITIAVEGFYPITSVGLTLYSFASAKEALPLIKFIISMVSSSLGMAKFFLNGPIPILSKDSPLNGLISLPFICTLLINIMFGCRVICIESAFFSSYRLQSYYDDERGVVQKTIDPIFAPEYRLLVYLAPSFLSFAINAMRLLTTGANIRAYIKKYPQLLIANCFTPFMFEGCEDDSIRVWRLGSIFNAFFIGCLPQAVLVLMDYQRGVPNWDFISLALERELIYENNDALFKSRHGNSLFAIVSGVFFLFLITLTFFTEKIFKSHGIHCKCFSVLCLPCPSNCVNLNSKIDTTQCLQTNPSVIKNDDERESEEANSIEQEDEGEEVKRSFIHMYVYSNGQIKTLRGNPSIEPQIESRKVSEKYLCHYELIL